MKVSFKCIYGFKLIKAEKFFKTFESKFTDIDYIWIVALTELAIFKSFSSDVIYGGNIYRENMPFTGLWSLPSYYSQESYDKH